MQTLSSLQDSGRDDGDNPSAEALGYDHGERGKGRIPQLRDRISNAEETCGYAALNWPGTVIFVYDLDLNADSRLANISTRGLVQQGDTVPFVRMIALGIATHSEPYTCRTYYLDAVRRFTNKIISSLHPLRL